MTVLAVVESSLAFYRDQIAADMEALRQTLAGVEPSDVSSSNIPMIGQMVMGFILPFVLAFVAIPFESFVSSSRTVIGIAAAWFLRTLTFVLRLSGNVGYYVSRMVVNVYDLVIFPALWLEGVIFKAFSKKGSKEETPDKADDNHIKEQATLMEEPAQCNEAIE
jgi:hypothetical protein